MNTPASPHPIPVRRSVLRFPLTVLLASVGCFSALADEPWPQFRGPEARGVGSSDRLPLTWGTTSNVAWRSSIPGRGWSSPIAWSDRVFLTTAVSDGETEPAKKGLYFGGERPTPSRDRHRWLALALNRETGAILWSTELHASPPATPIHVKNTYASETPVTDGERVYAYFGSIGVFALDVDGRILWSKPMEPRRMAHGWGTSASPVLHEGRLFLVNDNEESSFAMALDARTGRELWRISREEPSNFATPHVWRHPGGAELVVPGRQRVRSYDLVGRLLWEFQGMSTITIPTPFAADGLLYLCAGYVGDNLKPNKPVYAVRPGGRGDLTLGPDQRSSEFIAWMEPNSAPYNPSAIVYDGRFYVLWDFGFLSCRDAKTGREIYDKQRLNPTQPAAFTASPWAYRGRVFCLSEDGDTYVIKAGDRYALERVNALDEMCMATPALSGDRLLIRTLTRLYCLQEGR